MLITRKLMINARVIVITCLVLILLLCGFQAIPLTRYQTTYLLNADLQRVRSQLLVKSALTLEYRPAIEREQAISDLQVVLPLFISEQNVLTTSNHNDTHESALEARSDFLAMVSATQNILALANKKAPIDKTQVDILVAHNRPYLTAQGNTVNLILRHVQDEQQFLFFIEMIFCGLLILLLGSLYVGCELEYRKQRHVRRLTEEKSVTMVEVHAPPILDPNQTKKSEPLP